MAEFFEEFEEMENPLTVAGEEEHPFVVDSDLKAEWALTKMRGIDEHYSRLIDDCDKMIEFYEARKAQYEEKRDRETQTFEAMLAQYFDMVPHKHTQTQETYTLPSGKLVRRHYKPDYVRDEKRLMDWLMSNGLSGYIKIEQKLDWATLKKHLQQHDGEVYTDDGELVEGIELTTKPDSFSVTID